MPPRFDPQAVEIPFARGLDQKTGRLLRTPGVLRSAENAEADKAGALNKRRGYRSIDLTTTAHGETPELLFYGVATYRGELVLYGHSYVYSVAAPLPSVSGASLVRRGPSMRGNASVYHVASSAIGDG